MNGPDPSQIFRISLASHRVTLGSVHLMRAEKAAAGGHLTVKTATLDISNWRAFLNRATPDEMRFYSK